MKEHMPSRSHWLVFFIWPLLALWQAIRRPQRPWAKNVVWAFIIFFGFTFVIPNDGVDANRYRDNLVSMHSQHDIDWGVFVNMLYSDSGNFLDVFQPFITFLISRFTDDQRILFAVFGLVFGFFYTRNIWMVLDAVGKRIPSKIIPFIILFAMVVAFWQINGFRFWTATHMYLFGILTYMLRGKRYGLIVAGTSMFMHFAFIYPIVILGIYLILGNRVHLYFILFLASAFFVELSMDELIVRVPTLPSVYQEKVSDYTNQSYLSRVENVRVGYNWYVPFRALALKYLLYAYLIAAYIFRRKWLQSNGIVPLFCFSLLMFSITNLTTVIPSFTRYVIVSELFILVFIILFVAKKLEPIVLKRLYPVFILIIGLYLVVELRIGMDFLGVGTILSNPVSAFFFSNEMPLIEFIK